MIKILQPEQYKLVQNKTRSKDQIDGLSYDQSEDSSEDEGELQIQIVNTQEIGNQRVYRVSNYVLILFIMSIFIGCYIQSNKTKSIIIDNVQYIELPTLYTTYIEDKQTQITFLVPESHLYAEEEIQTISELCIKNQMKDCWKQMLLSQKSMFVEVERWFLENLQEESERILIFWKERLALGILLLNVNRSSKHYIDVVIQEDDSAFSIHCLILNLKRYGLEKYVKFMRVTQINTQLLRQYNLVVGNYELLDKLVYPEFLEVAINEGARQYVHFIIYDFVVHTNFLLFYNNLSLESRDILQRLSNQVTSITVKQSKMNEQIVQNFDRPISVIVLDERKKSNQIKIKEVTVQQVSDEELIQDHQITDEEKDNSYTQPILPPLLEIHRLESSKLLRFFECNAKRKQAAQVGGYQMTQFRGIHVIKSNQSQQVSQLSHFYNYVLHHQLALDSCNVLYLMESELIANLVATINTGQIYLPTSLNKKWQNIESSMYINNLARHLNKIQVSQHSLREFLYSHEISLTFITVQIFSLWFHQFRKGLDSNMNILMELEGSSQQANLIEQLIKSYFVFSIFESKSREYDTSCIRNFDVEYFEVKTYPKHTFLLISKTDILIEQVNPQFYQSYRIGRDFLNKKYPCFNDFNIVTQSGQYNLKKNSMKLIVNSKLTLMVDSSDSYEAIISKVKKEQGMISFLRNSIQVNDKIAIYSEKVPSMIIIITILQKVNTHGEVQFINLNQQQIRSIEKHGEMNSINKIYQFVNQPLSNPSDLLSFVLNNQISVLYLSSSVMKHSQGILAKMAKGSMILIDYKLKDEELELMLSKYRVSKKLFEVINIENKSNSSGLCQNYKINPLTSSFEDSPHHFDVNSWIVIVL